MGMARESSIYKGLLLSFTCVRCMRVRARNERRTIQNTYFKKTLLSGVNFINTNHSCFKCRIMAFKHQKWCSNFRKFRKTLLAFKRPIFGIFITNIGI